MEDRHMLRHQQKDEEAGGEGLGVVCTRKRLWRDADGNIVTKRPRSTQRSSTSSGSGNASFENNMPLEDQHHQSQAYEQPVSPPPSLANAETRIQDDFSCFVAPGELQAGFDFTPLMDANNDTMDFFIDTPWPSQPLEPLPALSGDVGFEEAFNPDTGRTITCTQLSATLTDCSELFQHALHDYEQLQLAFRPGRPQCDSRQ